ncbi:MAG: hypothetical protein VXZ15_03275 [Planctomycetota bacterium]|nr:hypothetical protein [Planctomycetota bacterium]
MDHSCFEDADKRLTHDASGHQTLIQAQRFTLIQPRDALTNADVPVTMVIPFSVGGGGWALPSWTGTGRSSPF